MYYLGMGLTWHFDACCGHGGACPESAMGN